MEQKQAAQSPMERNISKVAGAMQMVERLSAEINQMTQAGLMLPADQEAAIRGLHQASVPIEAVMGRLLYQGVGNGSMALQFAQAKKGETDGQGGQADDQKGGPAKSRPAARPAPKK